MVFCIKISWPRSQEALCEDSAADRGFSPRRIFPCQSGKHRFDLDSKPCNIWHNSSCFISPFIGSQSWSHLAVLELLVPHSRSLFYGRLMLCENSTRRILISVSRCSSPRNFSGAYIARLSIASASSCLPSLTKTQSRLLKLASVSGCSRSINFSRSQMHFFRLVVHVLLFQ